MTAPLPVGAVAVHTLVTLAISAAGGALAAMLNLPAAWLMGGAVAVAIAALCGVRVMLPNWLRDATFVMTGLSMGAAVARDSIALMAQWPLTLAALVIELVLIIAVTGFFLRKVFGLDKGTAYLSSFPGHLSFVMSIAAAGMGDSRQIVIIQVIRILLLTVCVPVGALFLPIGHYEGGPALALDLDRGPGARRHRLRRHRLRLHPAAHPRRLRARRHGRIHDGEVLRLVRRLHAAISCWRRSSSSSAR